MNAKQQTLATIKQLGGTAWDRVLIADIQAATSLPMPCLAAVLWELADQGDITLYKLDDPQEITERVKAAEITTLAGSPRHMAYLTR